MTPHEPQPIARRSPPLRIAATTHDLSTEALLNLADEIVETMRRRRVLGSLVQRLSESLEEALLASLPGGALEQRARAIDGAVGGGLA